MQPTRRTQPHRRKGRVMENGQTLAAMLRGAGSLGNPQDVRRATVKRAKTPGNLGIADGGDAQLGPAGLPPHSGASGLGAMLAAVPLRRAQPGGAGLDPREHVWPDSDPRTRAPGSRIKPGRAEPSLRPRRDTKPGVRKHPVWRGRRNPYRNA